ncbi:hypothetical protein PCAR4_290058 [Paraburkholderia caribensis]|nr:hypothetical protein PCAR4_290058 [Paraburkholderia caribensis]
MPRSQSIFEMNNNGRFCRKSLALIFLLLRYNHTDFVPSIEKNNLSFFATKIQSLPVAFSVHQGHGKKPLSRKRDRPLPAVPPLGCPFIPLTACRQPYCRKAGYKQICIPFANLRRTFLIFQEYAA